MASELVKELIDSGIHFGHRASRWNPKMGSYIFSKRNSIHIIDIRETVKGLLRAKKFIAQVVGEGGDILFVGTKRQARLAVEQTANSAKMPYVADRWLGGTLTNFRTIRSRLKRLEELETLEADGRAEQYGKKQQSRNLRERKKIHRNLVGIREMTKLPGALFVIDVQREKLALREARALHIPSVCLIDTDSDPDMADIPIPGNDDAMRSIELVLTHVREAIDMGLRGRQAAAAAVKEEAAAKRAARAVSAGDGERGKSEGGRMTESAVAPAIRES
ncbi:MAG: 30S ribosomal protein S2 [Phycisphaerales bacterium]|nr:30S ribosomal protein S2 [Phycisphaerales bacterium]